MLSALLTNRNLLLLFTCQVVFVSGTVVLVTIGGIIGHSLAVDPSFATLPVAFMVVGTACATVPAAMCMQALGRRGGFSVGVCVAALGACVAYFAVTAGSFWGFCGATVLIGSSLGFSQQFRFAAAESVNAPIVSHAISFILVGSIVGAFLAPEIIRVSIAMSDGASAESAAVYGNAFLIILGLYVVAGVVVQGLRGLVVQDEEVAQAEPRPLKTIALTPLFITAVVAGVVGQGVMTYIMTATPISMNVSSGFSIQDTSEVIRAHVIAMYVPSLFTPFLIARFGLMKVIVLGAIIFAVTLFIGLAGHHYMHYWWSMVLLGVGWNFLFVSGTTLLTQTYRPAERFKCQAVNDFSVFAGSAAASLLAGTVLHAFGWETLLVSAWPGIAIVLLAVLWLYRSGQLKPA